MSVIMRFALVFSVICASACAGRESASTSDAETSDDEGDARESDTSSVDVFDDSTVDGERPCTATGHECSAAEYCDAPKCASGTCKPRPTTPSLALAEVCGCDGITYWNAEQAAANGATFYYAGECGGGATPTPPGTCGAFYGGKTCPAGTTCVLFNFSFCTFGDTRGQCWLIPTGATCPADLGDAGYRNCETSTCLTYCEAVKTGVLVAGCI